MEQHYWNLENLKTFIVKQLTSTIDLLFYFFSRYFSYSASPKKVEG